MDDSDIEKTLDKMLTTAMVVSRESGSLRPNVVSALIQAQVQMMTTDKICKEIEELKEMLHKKQMFTYF